MTRVGIVTRPGALWLGVALGAAASGCVGTTFHPVFSGVTEAQREFSVVRITSSSSRFRLIPYHSDDLYLFFDMPPGPAYEPLQKIWDRPYYALETPAYRVVCGHVEARRQFSVRSAANRIWLIDDDDGGVFASADLDTCDVRADGQPQPDWAKAALGTPVANRLPAADRRDESEE